MNQLIPLASVGAPVLPFVAAFTVAAVMCVAAFGAHVISEGGGLIPMPGWPRLPPISRPRFPRPRLPHISSKRVGGLRFVKVGRLSVSWSIAKPERQKTRKRTRGAKI